MLSYIARRIAISIVVLLGIASVTFLMIHLVPGDPARILLGLHATPERVSALRQELGLDRPLGEQFLAFLQDTLTGDFGRSISFHAPVGETIASRLAPSAILVGYGLCIALLLGVPMAIVAAVRQGGIIDNAIRLVSTFSFAMPPFWLGLMLAFVLGLQLKLFPVSGYQPGIGGALRSMTLPALTLGLVLLVVVVRNLRSTLVDVLRSDYIEAARARGFSERRVVLKHALRNSVIGTITILGSLFGFVISVMVLIEAVFQIPGAGTLLVQAVQKRDYELVQGLALMSGAIVVIVGLFTDICHAVIDPRIRLSGRHE
jgi:ABC-type dipeptide/oligopeptide/nickel transport system permease component